MKIKSFILFLLIFGVGFGAGFIISGRITNKKIAEVKRRQTPAGFKDEIYKYIKPNQNQKKYLDSVISEYLPKIKKENEIRQEYQKKLRDSMFAQIQNMLDKKQKTKFNKYQETVLSIDKSKKQNIEDTSKSYLKRKKKSEIYRESLSPEQQAKLDSAIERRKKDLKNPLLKKEIWQYTKQNIYPVLFKYRLEFDEELDEEEKGIIADLIEKRKDYRAEFLQSQIEETENGEAIGKMKDFNIEAREALLPIALNHKIALEKIINELAPYRIIWEKDINEIKSKYIENYKPPARKHQKIREKNIIDFLLINTKSLHRKRRFNK